MLGISANTIFSQKAFVDFIKLNYPLLSDREGKVMQSFGVYDSDRRLAKRSYVIIDKSGVIRYLNVRPTNSGKDLVSTDELLNEVRKINNR